jgi:hypothetical protein
LVFWNNGEGLSNILTKLLLDSGLNLQREEFTMTVVRLSSLEVQLNWVKLFWTRLNVLLDCRIEYILLSTENLSQVKEMRYLEDGVVTLFRSDVTSAKAVKTLVCLSNLKMVKF